MTRSVAAGEPTMEDILASIRKIIAEEPAAVPASASGGPFAGAPVSVAPVPAPKVAPAPFAAPERSGDPARTAPNEQPPKAGASALFGRLSEALRGPSATSTTAAAATPAAAPRTGVAGIDDDLADMLEDPAPRSPASLPLRDASAMRGTGLPLPTGRRESPLGGPLVSAPPPPPPGRIEPSLGALPAPASGAGGSRAADLGAFVPARPDAARPADPAGAPPFGRRINETPPHDMAPPPQAPRPLPEVIAAMPSPTAASTAPAALPATPEPAPERTIAAPDAAAAPIPQTRTVQAAAPVARAEPTVVAAMPAALPAAPAVANDTTTDPDTTAAAASALSELVKGLKASAAPSGGTEPSTPAKPEPVASPGAPPASASASDAATLAATAPASEATVQRDASAIGAHVKPTTPKAAEAPETSSSVQPEPAPATVVAAAATAPVAEPPAPVVETAKPAAAASAGSTRNAPEPAAKVADPATPAPTASAASTSTPSAPALALSLAGPAAGGEVRTLEDTVAELLRPMLRQWLDDNMPRIVEKALRVEIAGRPNPPAGRTD